MSIDRNLKLPIASLLSSSHHKNHSASTGCLTNSASYHSQRRAYILSDAREANLKSLRALLRPSDDGGTVTPNGGKDRNPGNTAAELKSPHKLPPFSKPVPRDRTLEPSIVSSSSSPCLLRSASHHSQRQARRLSEVSLANLDSLRSLLRPSDDGGTEAHHHASVILVGLENIGNTCFMNAALQCLVHTSAFARFFLNGSYKKHVCTDDTRGGGRLVESFVMLLNEMHQTGRGGRGGGDDSTSATSTARPTEFKEEIGKWAPQFKGYKQHDSHEFLRFLLDGLMEGLNKKSATPSRHFDDDEGDVVLSESTLENMTRTQQQEYWWSRNLTMNPSFITNIFCGQLMSEIECMTCHNKSLCFDPFYDLSVPIPPKGEPSSFSSGLLLPQIIKNRSSSKNNGTSSSKQYQGTNNNHKTNNNNSNESEHPSCSLEDCLRCFSAVEILDGPNKRACSVCKSRQKSTKRLLVSKFPPVLVIHMKRFAHLRCKLDTRVSIPLTGLDLGPFSSQNANVHTSSSRKCVYDLYAVINHIGVGPQRGHYTANCVDGNFKQWYNFNDKRVSKVDAETFLSSNQPYLLFYKLKD